MESLEERLKYYRAVFTDCGKYIDDEHCLNENRPEGKRIDCEYCVMEFIREKTIKDVIAFIEEKDKKAGPYSIYRKLLAELKERYGVDL